MNTHTKNIVDSSKTFLIRIKMTMWKKMELSILETLVAEQKWSQRSRAAMRAEQRLQGERWELTLSRSDHIPSSRMFPGCRPDEHVLEAQAMCPPGTILPKMDKIDFKLHGHLGIVVQSAIKKSSNAVQTHAAARRPWPFVSVILYLTPPSTIQISEKKIWRYDDDEMSMEWEWKQEKEHSEKRLGYYIS